MIGACFTRKQDWICSFKWHYIFWFIFSFNNSFIDLSNPSVRGMGIKIIGWRYPLCICVPKIRPSHFMNFLSSIDQYTSPRPNWFENLFFNVSAWFSEWNVRYLDNILNMVKISYLLCCEKTFMIMLQIFAPSWIWECWECKMVSAI